MKQRALMDLVDGIAPVIMASFAKAMAPIATRIEAAEKRLAEFADMFKAAPSEAEIDAIVVAAVEKALAEHKPKEIAALELKVDSGDLTKAVEEAIARIQPDEAAVRAVVAEEISKAAATSPKVEDVVAGAVGKAVGKLSTELDEVRVLVTGLPGPDGLVALVDKAVDTKVAAAVGALPPAPTAVEIAALVPAPPTVEAVAALIPPPVPGKDADPEVIATMVRDAAAALMTPMQTAIDTAIADVRTVAESASADVKMAIAGLPSVPTVAEVAALIPPPPAGKDADPEATAALVAAEVQKAVAGLPPAAPGRDADPEAVRVMVAEAVAELPPTKDGRDATPEQITAAVEKVLATWERPKDGASVTIEQLRPLVDETVAKRIAEIPAPKDGVGMAGAVIDREGELALTMTDGTVVKLGQVIGRDGAPGLGFDDLEVIHDGERGFTFRLMQGDRVKEFPFSLPVVLDRGVFKDGTEYVAGDGTTWGGSFWIARTTTKDKPGTSDAWRLSVKKGRDGQDLRPSEPKPPTKVKL